MIRISNIKIPVNSAEPDLKAAAAKALKISVRQIKKVSIAKKSIDARNKSRICFLFSLDVEADNEAAVCKHCKGACAVQPYSYSIPTPSVLPDKSPVVAGMGPCGTFCGFGFGKGGL